MIQADPLRVLVLTGPVGVGKTTVATAISDMWAQAGHAHALIDMDWLRWCSPRPADDPFHTALGLQNLAAVCNNYRAAGAQRLILVDVVETHAMIEAYRAAMPHAAITVVRLSAGLATLHARLAGRESGDSLAWHQHRAAELAEHWQRTPVEDILIATDGKTVAEVAANVLDRLHWTSGD